MMIRYLAFSLFDTGTGPSGQVNTTSINGVGTLISNAIIIASFLAGAVSVIFIIVGGIQYITSAGGDGVKKAKTTITFAVLGLVLSITAYAIVTFLLKSLGGGNFT